MVTFPAKNLPWQPCYRHVNVHTERSDNDVVFQDRLSFDQIESSLTFVGVSALIKENQNARFSYACYHSGVQAFLDLRC